MYQGFTCHSACWQLVNDFYFGQSSEGFIKKQFNKLMEEKSNKARMQEI